MLYLKKEEDKPLFDTLPTSLPNRVIFLRFDN